MIKDKPLFGFGTMQFYPVHNEYQANYFQNSKTIDANELLVADNIEYAFNEFIQITTEYGIVGLIIFSTFVVLILGNSANYKLNNPYISEIIKIGIWASVLSILITSFFSYPLHSIPTTINFFVFLGFLSSYYYPLFEFKNINCSGFFKIFLLSGILIFIFFLL